MFQSFENQPAGLWGLSACISCSPVVCCVRAFVWALQCASSGLFVTAMPLRLASKCLPAPTYSLSGICAVRCLHAGTTYLAAALQSVLIIACTLCMQAHQSPYIRHATQLEQWLMEGAYNKVLGAKSSAPDVAYATLMERLVSTVRCAQSPEAAGTCCSATGLFDQCKRLVLLDMLHPEQLTVLPIA